VTGLLAPYIDASGPRWRLVPRGASDIATETKFADVGITTSFSPTTASAGDTVEIRVTARNGPGAQATHIATNVSVSDTVPAGLTFISASATRGSYDQATRTWTVGSLAPGAVADTLRIRVEVTGGPGSVTNRAHFGGLVREVETNGANNSAATSPNLTIS